MISLMKENTNIKHIIKDIRLYDGYSHLVLSLGLPSGFHSAIFEIAYFLYAYKRELKKSNDGDSC